MDNMDFAGLLARVKEGDEIATRELIERFGPEVRIMVRRRLPARLRGQFDTDDFTQEVWSSVIDDCRERLEPFDEPKHLLGYLAAVVQNKVTQEFRRRTRTRKYDIAREEPLYIRKGDGVVPRDLAGSDPTPSEEVQAGDRLEQLVTGRSPTEILIVKLRRDGLTFEAIGARVGLHEKAVRRVIENLRSQWEAKAWR
jgi:RNA polymerase sigma factor (sigma-70 family)